MVKISDSGVMPFKIDNISSSRFATVIGGSHTSCMAGTSVFVVLVGVIVTTTGADIGVRIVGGLMFGEMTGAGIETGLVGVSDGIYR